MNIADIQIRRAKLTDIDVMMDVEIKATHAFQHIEKHLLFADYMQMQCLDEIVQSTQSYEKWVSDGVSLVALNSNQIIAFICAESISADHTLHIHEFDVDELYQRQGIGTKLLAYFIADARAHEIKALTLTTFRSMPWNKPFYEQFGFTEIQPTPSRMLAQLLTKEISLGLRADNRCAMRLSLCV